jgi:hypothetical protein
MIRHHQDTKDTKLSKFFFGEFGVLRVLVVKILSDFRLF